MKPHVLLVLLVAFGILFMGYVWGKVDTVRVGYTIEKLSQKKKILIREHETLRLRLSQLTAADQIALKAKEELGMGVAEPGQIILVSMTPPSGDNEVGNQELLRVARGPNNEP